MNLDLRSQIAEFLSLEPKHFHLTDTDLNKVFDRKYNEDHLNLGKGDMDINLILDIIPEDAWVTLETPQIQKDPERQIKEILCLERSA
ncbi:MAG: hypothetical protein WA063_05145 [Minisyncoccia bacterium]